MLVLASGLALVRRLVRVYVPHWSKQQQQKQRAASRRGKSKKKREFSLLQIDFTFSAFTSRIAIKIDRKTSAVMTN